MGTMLDYVTSLKNYLDSETIEGLLNHVYNNAVRGEAASVVKAIEEYEVPEATILCIAKCKVAAVEKIIEERKPRVLAELGGFVGYSAIKFTIAARKENPDAHYYSVELNPILASVAESLIKFAGLSEAITIFKGNLTSCASILKTSIRDRFGVNENHLDFLLLDHPTRCFIPDIELAQQEGFLKKGSIVVADNILIPGAPEYQSYMDMEAQKSKFYSTFERYGRDALLTSIVL